jgi:hypothetical protein
VSKKTRGGICSIITAFGIQIYMQIKLVLRTFCSNTVTLVSGFILVLVSEPSLEIMRETNNLVLHEYMIIIVLTPSECKSSIMLQFTDRPEGQ